MRFVGNIVMSTKYEFYFDDVTVTSFIDIKCGDVAIQSIPEGTTFFFRLPWAKKTWHKCHSLLDVTSV